MSETKSILFASSDGIVKEQVFGALDGIEECSLAWVDNSGDLLINALDKEIDLTIINENLDGMALSKLIEIVKKSRPRIPLIIISSDDSREELTRVLEHGIFYFIIKPINSVELREAVESALKIKPVKKTGLSNEVDL